jgi:toxin ParE1/3/4
LEQLAAYLWNESPMRAGEIIDRIVARVAALESMPLRGRTPPELEAIGDRTWRELVESPWRILYKFGSKRIEIHGVLDGRRSLQDILMERLLHS